MWRNRLTVLPVDCSTASARGAASARCATSYVTAIALMPGASNGSSAAQSIRRPFTCRPRPAGRGAHPDHPVLHGARADAAHGPILPLGGALPGVRPARLADGPHPPRPAHLRSRPAEAAVLANAGSGLGAVARCVTWLGWTVPAPLELALVTLSAIGAFFTRSVPAIGDPIIGFDDQDFAVGNTIPMRLGVARKLNRWPTTGWKSFSSACACRNSIRRKPLEPQRVQRVRSGRVWSLRSGESSPRRRTCSWRSGRGSGRRSAHSRKAICSHASRSTTARRPRRSPPRGSARGSPPGSTLLLPALRHTPHREAPEVVLGAVADFVAG